ncbi:MAG: hypothetical protein ACREHC_02735 [Candidatus Levyibacteriota bacterium]
MKKKNNHGSSMRNVWAVLVGLLVLYLGAFVFSFAALFLRGYIDQTYYENAFAKLVYVQNLNGVPMHTVQNAVNSVATWGVISGIIIVLMILLFAVSGWVVEKIAKNKVWFLPAVPGLFISFFAFTHTSAGNYNILAVPFTQFFDGPIKPYAIFLCILAALFGGWMQQHVSVRK